MNHFAATLGWELRIQARQGIYYAALVVVAVWIAVLFALPTATRTLLLPFALFMDVSIFGVFLMAGMLFLEKGDRVLQALVVTPMPRSNYLLTKLATLTLVGVVASLLLTLVVHGMHGVNWPMLFAGTALNGWLMTLFGFILAARYGSINEFLVPSIIFFMPSQLPLLDYFGIWQSWLIYLIPTQPAMLLIGGAFRGIETWQLLYALVYLTVACVLVSWWALRVFDRFVVEMPGGND
jgi:fluoroquinolone transport system permease protein